MGVLKSNQWNWQAPLRQKMRVHIKLERKYPSKFKNVHIKLSPQGQEIYECGLRVTGCGLRVTGSEAADSNTSKTFDA